VTGCEQALNKLAVALNGSGSNFSASANQFVNGQDGHNLWETTDEVTSLRINTPRISIRGKGFRTVVAPRGQMSLDGKTIVLNKIDTGLFPNAQVAVFLHEVFHKGSSGNHDHETIVNAIVGLGIDGLSREEFAAFSKREGWERRKGEWVANPYSDLLNAWITKHCLGNPGTWDYLLKRGQFRR
jgi:hypothetical protein